MERFELANEKLLLWQVSESDEAAFRIIVHHYSRLLAPYIIRFTKSKEKTEEIVQDIFLQVWLRRETLPEIHHFKSFLFVISRNSALNAVRDMIREEKRRKKWEQENARPAESFEESVQLPVNLVEEAVRQLPSQQQKVWILSRRRGMKHTEIAMEMNISRETVKKYVRYANASIMHYVQSRIELMIAILATLIQY